VFGLAPLPAAPVAGVPPAPLVVPLAALLVVPPAPLVVPPPVPPAIPVPVPAPVGPAVVPVEVPVPAFGRPATLLGSGTRRPSAVIIWPFGRSSERPSNPVMPFGPIRRVCSFVTGVARPFSMR
jgi:hypothetical protein